MSCRSFSESRSEEREGGREGGRGTFLLSERKKTEGARLARKMKADGVRKERKAKAVLPKDELQELF